MITAVQILMSFSFIMFSLSTNPVKMSSLLMIKSALMFVLVYMFTNLSWYPLLFYLIFLGGIMVTFMVLSSVMPNMASKGKKKMSILWLVVVASTCWQLAPAHSTSTGPDQMSFLLHLSQCMPALAILMSIYFYFTISKVSKNENPLRSYI